MTLLRLTNASNSHRREGSDAVVPLTVADIPKLHLTWHPRLQADTIARALERVPGISQWHPRSGEFLLATPWRHRDDIVAIRDLTAFHHEDALVAASLAAAQDSGMIAYIASESYEKRKPEFYARNGFARVESVVSYTHERVADYLDVTSIGPLDMRPVTIADSELLDQVMAVDHAAFAPIWRNSAAEFWWWMQQQSVEVWAGVIDATVVSYYGVTYYQRFGHLDRIAVLPEHQGKGYGAATLMAAMHRMASMGLPNAALTTQHDNPASQHLYARAGFRRHPRDDYEIYGVIFPTEATDHDQ